MTYKSDRANVTVQLGEQGSVGGGHVVSESLRHSVGPDGRGDCRSNRISNFGDEENHSRYRCNVLVRYTGLSRKLDASRGDTAAHALKDLVHDELAGQLCFWLIKTHLACGSTSATRVNHETATKETDQETAEQKPLECQLCDN